MTYGSRPFEDYEKNMQGLFIDAIEDRMKDIRGSGGSEGMLEFTRGLSFELRNDDDSLSLSFEDDRLVMTSGVLKEVFLWGLYLSSPQYRGTYLTRALVMILQMALAALFNDDPEQAVEDAEKVFNNGKYGREFGLPSPLEDIEKAAAMHAPDGDREELERQREGRFLPGDVCPNCRTNEKERLSGFCKECNETGKTCPECGKTFTGERCEPCYNKEWKCTDCGDTYTGGKGNGICGDCYGKRWDEGFQSTSEHAYEIGHSDLNRKLDGPLPEKFEDIVGEILGEWDTDKWLCTKCKAVRLEGEKKLGAKEVVKLLKKPCPKCKAKGHLEHVVKGKYFH